MKILNSENAQLLRKIGIIVGIAMLTV